MTIGEEVALALSLGVLKVGVFVYSCWRFDRRCVESEGWRRSLWFIWKLRWNYLDFSDLPGTAWGNFVTRMRIYDFVWNALIAFVLIFLFIRNANH
jgi:hypothetical protein